MPDKCNCIQCRRFKRDAARPRIYDRLRDSRDKTKAAHYALEEGEYRSALEYIAEAETALAEAFERVALPATGGSGGAPDSRSETLSPREWPTLEAALLNIIARAERCNCNTYLGGCGCGVDCGNIAEDVLETMRRGRPRGESRVLNEPGSDR